MSEQVPSNERCINWPCAMRKGHVGPCSTSPEQRSSKQGRYYNSGYCATACGYIVRERGVESWPATFACSEHADRFVAMMNGDAVPPPAVDVAPIAKLTVRDGLVQRAGLYAPGLPDGDHDVFPVPLSPKGELRPHVLAEPPSAWQPIETAPKGVALLVGYRNELGNWRTVIARYYLPGTLTAGDDDYDENVDEDGYAKEGWYEENEAYEFIRRTKEQPTHWTPLPDAPAETKPEDRELLEIPPFLRAWVDCPACGEQDMRQENGVIHCTNEACPSKRGVDAASAANR